jgi:hypothetical protein
MLVPERGEATTKIGLFPWFCISSQVVVTRNLREWEFVAAEYLFHMSSQVLRLNNPSVVNQ